MLHYNRTNLSGGTDVAKSKEQRMYCQLLFAF